ncbi:HD domain-containing protein [Candidatus Parcubacteria bacterium]|nr:HD domain-containing protein [Candidatus Parcubacteria bacterium]
MKHLTDLFHLLEVTRKQPQYGYALWGGDMRLGNLAEHHYLVTIIAWQLASAVNTKGAKIDIQKVLEFCLIHDLGELFGGDVGMLYARANPKAREYAKKFEAENHIYIGKFFGNQRRHFLELSEEILNADSDESRIAKIADYLEITHYKFFMEKFTQTDIDLVAKKLPNMIDGMKDILAKRELNKFVKEWQKSMSSSKSYRDTISKIIR